MKRSQKRIEEIIAILEMKDEIVNKNQHSSVAFQLFNYIIDNPCDSCPNKNKGACYCTIPNFNSIRY